MPLKWPNHYSADEAWRFVGSPGFNFSNVPHFELAVTKVVNLLTPKVSFWIMGSVNLGGRICPLHGFAASLQYRGRLARDRWPRGQVTSV